MAQTMLETAQLKSLLKEALIEVLEERGDLVRGLFEEALENVAMARAIEEGKATEIVDRREVFEIFERAE